MSKIEFSLELLRKEIKKIINEVLDEREKKKKLEGPYDVPEEYWQKSLINRVPYDTL